MRKKSTSQKEGLPSASQLSPRQHPLNPQESELYNNFQEEKRRQQLYEMFSNSDLTQDNLDHSDNQGPLNFGNGSKLQQNQGSQKKGVPHKERIDLDFSKVISQRYNVNEEETLTEEADLSSFKPRERDIDVDFVDCSSKVSKGSPGHVKKSLTSLTKAGKDQKQAESSAYETDKQMPQLLIFNQSSEFSSKQKSSRYYQDKKISTTKANKEEAHLVQEEFVANEKHPLEQISSQKTVKVLKEYGYLDWFFTEMRTEYLKQLVESQELNEQEVRQAEEQFIQSMRQVQKFNKLFKEIFPNNIENILQEKRKGTSQGKGHLSKSEKTKLKNQVPKLVFLLFAFDIKEWHTLFTKFYKELEKAENFTFNLEQMTFCFETFAKEDMLGRSSMKKVLKSIVPNVIGGIMSIFKEGHYINQVFPPEIYQKIFQRLAKDSQGYIKLFVSPLIRFPMYNYVQNFIPYLQLFFVSKMFHGIEKRKKYFQEMLDDDSKSGIFQAFLRAGLDPSNLYGKKISYRMVEKVVIDIKVYYPDSFGFDQQQSVLKQVQSKMSVDPLSLIEQEKASYLENKDGYSFSKWFAFMQVFYASIQIPCRVGLQLMFSELRKKELEKQDYSPDRLAFEFFFEERIWYSAATLNSFKVHTFQNQVLAELQNKILKRQVPDQTLAEYSSIMMSPNPFSMTSFDGIDQSFSLFDFTESLTLVLQLYCPWAKTPAVERATYYYLWNLLEKAQNFYNTDNGMSSSQKKAKKGQSGDFNKHMDKIVSIFGSAYTNINLRRSLLAKMQKVKFMRYIRLTETTIVDFSFKILTKESLRVINEHAMRLLLDHQLNYQRQYDEILPHEKQLLEGKVVSSPKNYMGVELQVNELDATVKTSQRLRQHSVQRHMKSKKRISQRHQKNEKSQISRKRRADSSRSLSEGEEPQEQKKDLIGVLLSTERIIAPYERKYASKQVDNQEKFDQTEESTSRSNQVLSQKGNHREHLSTQNLAQFTKEDCPREERQKINNKEKRFDLIQLYKQVDRTKLWSQLKHEEQKEQEREIQRALVETKQSSNTNNSNNDNQYTSNLTFGGPKNRIVFEKRNEKGANTALHRRQENARRLKGQMLTELYRNDSEFQEGDLDRSCLRGCEAGCEIF